MSGRLLGQDVSVRVITDGVVEDTIDSISSVNENVMLETKQQGFLGQYVDQFDTVMNGFGADFEFQTSQANWTRWQQAIIDKAQRRRPNTIFNVVVTDFFENGDSIVNVYSDVSWGESTKATSARGDYVKIKGQFKCSERPQQTNSLP